MRRRPLLRAAAIAGGAYYAAKRRMEAKQRAYEETHVQLLERLGRLHELGVLSDEEYAAQRAVLKSE